MSRARSEGAVAGSIPAITRGGRRFDPAGPTIASSQSGIGGGSDLLAAEREKTANLAQALARAVERICRT